MNENIEKLCSELLHYDDMIFGWREKRLGPSVETRYTKKKEREIERFAELIVQECIKCYSPDDSAADWADKMRRMIKP